MATQVQYVEWKTEKVSQLVGRKPKLDAQGNQMKSAKGINQWERITKEREMEFPQLSPKAISDPSDLTWAVQEILEAQKPGFTSLTQVLDHLNHGLYRGPAVMLNKGQDIRLSASQIEALNTMVGIFKKGFITDIDQIVDILERQGIPDARRELQVRLEVSDSDEDSEGSEE